VVSERALSIMFNTIIHARVWRNYRLYDLLNVARCCDRCYDNSLRSLVIVSTLVLRLKVTESFLETKIQIKRGVKRENFIRYLRRSG